MDPKPNRDGAMCAVIQRLENRIDLGEKIATCQNRREMIANCDGLKACFLGNRRGVVATVFGPFPCLTEEGRSMEDGFYRSTGDSYGFAHWVANQLSLDHIQALHEAVVAFRRLPPSFRGDF